jgi:mannitol operon transcriptional antiterminator
MVPLTTHQRELLKLLLTTEGSLGAVELGERVGLSARQIHYNLRAVENWLAHRKSGLQKQPGIGIAISGPSVQKHALLDEFKSLHNFQLILTAGQRQQLLAIDLLLAREPHILYQWQRDAEVSRTTILKDLEQLNDWITTFGLVLERRPNYGCWLEGAEWRQRQALAALLWGDVPFDDPLLKMTHTHGIVFVLSEDAALLPIVQRADTFIRACDTQNALEEVVRAEAELDGRFTDEALLQIALTLAIQVQRVHAGRQVAVDEHQLAWVQAHPIWQVASRVATHLWAKQPTPAPTPEIAAITMQLLAGAREVQWNHGIEIDLPFTSLINDLVARIVTAYQLPDLAKDSALRSGLTAQIIPAVMRVRFGLWTPPAPASEAVPAKYAFEHQLVQKLAMVIAAQTGVILPDSELHDLIFLLRAAFIRERPMQPHRILVVCPSGMAMSQLLLARLKARFPTLGQFELRSLRELGDEAVASADLIITTVPLYRPMPKNVHVIQVHPMLTPTDIQAITEWMTS